MSLNRYVLIFLLLSIVLLCVVQCYLTKQGLYLIRYTGNAEKIDELLTSGDIGTDEKELLSLVKEIKEYSVSTIGLRSDRSYTKYIEVEKDYLIDVVSACAKDRFDPYLWKFPLFGAFPYKGFYVRRDAERQAERLRRKGLDVLIRKVETFSTLGFFSDPVYSFMKDYSVYSLASLIIHEQTHATIFLKNRIQFNEECATFVGNEGALRFIKDKYGTDSEYYTGAQSYRADLDTFFALFRELYEELNSLYESEAEKEYKLTQREEIFSNFRQRVKAEYTELFETDAFRRIFELKLNNAFVLSVNRYTGDLQLFYDLYDKYGQDLRKTVDVLKELKGYRGDPKEFIQTALK